MSAEERHKASAPGPEALVARIRSGDRDAEAVLVQRYSRGLMMLLRKRSNDPAEAEDCHQEAFRVVIERLRARELEEPEKLAQFIRKTAVNVLIGRHRKHARRQTVADTDRIINQADSAPGIIEQISAERRQALVRELLDELPVERDREILRRFYLSPDEKEEICGALELSSVHFDRVLYRAKTRFRELIEREPGSSDSAELLRESDARDQWSHWREA